MLLLPLIVMFGLAVIVIYAGLWVARWIGGTPGLIVVCTAAIGYVIYQIIDINNACNAEPDFIPPDCSDESRCGIGTMVFPCDGPGGAMIYGVTDIILPLTVIVLAAFTFRMARRSRPKSTTPPN